MFICLFIYLFIYLCIYHVSKSKFKAENIGRNPFTLKVSYRDRIQVWILQIETRFQWNLMLNKIGMFG